MTERSPKDIEDRNVRKDQWEVLNKASNSLIIAHGAGLVACVSLLKDYTNNAQLKGSGAFIGLFGVGLVTAILCSVFLLILRTQYLRGPRGHESNYPALVRTLTVLANVSVLILIFAILLAVYKFSTL